MMPEYTDPTTDGIDHINIYSKGYTKLGRLLSNFTKSEFTHPISRHPKYFRSNNWLNLCHMAISM
jgi:hypothetical protein